MPAVKKITDITGNDIAFLECLKRSLISFVTMEMELARAEYTSHPNLAASGKLTYFSGMLLSASKIDVQSESVVPTLLALLPKIDARKFQLELPDGQKLDHAATRSRLKTMRPAKGPSSLLDVLIKEANLLTLAVTTQLDRVKSEAAAAGTVTPAQSRINEQVQFVLSILSQLTSFLRDVKKEKLSDDGQEVINSLGSHLDGCLKNLDVDHPAKAACQMIAAFQQTKYARFFSDVLPNKNGQLPSSHTEQLPVAIAAR